MCNVAITRYATAQRSRAALAAGPRRRRTIRSSAPRCAAPAIAGASASVTSDFPIGAGLGGSSAAGVALAGALAALRGRDRWTPRRSPSGAARTEVEELGVAGGFQDHYAAAFGGALLLTFGDGIAVERLATCRMRTRDAARAARACWSTPASRASPASTITAVLDAYRARDARGVRRARAHEGARRARWRPRCAPATSTRWASWSSEHWAHQRALHPAITTDAHRRRSPARRR